MVLRPDHPLASRAWLEPGDLGDERFISLGADFYMKHCTDPATADVLARAGYHSANLTLPACGQVAAGLGIALADPLTARMVGTFGLITLPFHPVVSYPIAIAESGVSRASRSATAIYNALEESLSDIARTVSPTQ